MAKKKLYRCSDCGRWKSEPFFHKNKARTSGVSSSCRPCRAQYDKKRTAIGRKFLYEYLQTHPCIDCGEDDITVLEFDHVRGKKIKSIADMVTRPVEVIQKELQKCVVRCANCHRRKTAAELNWWSHRKKAEARNEKIPQRKTHNPKTKKIVSKIAVRVRNSTRTRGR